MLLCLIELAEVWLFLDSLVRTVIHHAGFVEHAVCRCHCPVYLSSFGVCDSTLIISSNELISWSHLLMITYGDTHPASHLREVVAALPQRSLWMQLRLSTNSTLATSCTLHTNRTHSLQYWQHQPQITGLKINNCCNSKEERLPDSQQELLLVLLN